MTTAPATTNNSTLSESNNASLMSTHHHQSNDSTNSYGHHHGSSRSHHHHHNQQHHHHQHQQQHHHHQAPSHHKDHHMFMKKRVFMRTFDLSQIAEDPMDNYLDTLGLWKKRIARDGSCLFRAVAEQIYPCQMYHEKVRLECIQYMSDHKEEFSKHLMSISFEDYLEIMKNPFEYGGQLEIAAMSKLYRRDFIIYQAPDQAGINVTLNDFPLKINLCYSYNHFDAIFTKEHRDRLALIQSLVYEILYDRVFGSGEQVSVARRLLRKSDTIYPKEYMNDVKNYDELLDYEDYDSEEHDGEQHGDEMIDEDDNDDQQGQNHVSETSDDSADSGDNKQLSSSDINNNDEQALDRNDNESKKYKKQQANDSDKSLSLMQKMPLPYKVAKSLDPVIYRNTAFDAWLAAKREHEEMLNQKAIAGLQPGDKCLVRLSSSYGEKWNTAYVHNIHSDSANVFIADLNEHHFVSLDNLKAYNDGHHHYHGNSNYGGGDMKAFGHHHGGSQNVQKLVQSINQQFSKVFINSDNKRRNLNKKKQFSMVKKSSSFHAFSTELPPLPEVNEDQLDDPFHYASLGGGGYMNGPGGNGGGGRYYFNTQMHPSHHSHHQNNHPLHGGLPHGGMMMGGVSGHGGHGHHQHHQSGNGSYYSMPHSQSHHGFVDVASSSNNANSSTQSNNKLSSQPPSAGAKSSNMPSSVSNPNLRSGTGSVLSASCKIPPSQSASNMAPGGSLGNFATAAAAGPNSNKNRRQRYNVGGGAGAGFNQNNMPPLSSSQPNNFSYLSYPNNNPGGGANVKGPWNVPTSSFGSGNGLQPMQTTGGNQPLNSLSNQYPMGGMQQQPPIQNSAQQQPGHGLHQLNSTNNSAFNGAPIQPPLLSTNPGFPPLQPPPLAGPPGSQLMHSQMPNGSMPPPQLAPPNGSNYMPHPPPLAMGPPHPGNMNQQRPGYFNPPNMFPQPIGHMAPSLLQHPPQQQHSVNNPGGYYFPQNSMHNHQSSSKSANDRKRNDNNFTANNNNNNFAPKTTQTSNNSSSTAPSSSNSATSTNATTASASQAPANTSNYLLMPVSNLPQQHQPNSSLSGSSSLQHQSSANYSNLPGSAPIGNSSGSINPITAAAAQTSSGNISRSHSYHGTIAHDNASSSGYMDMPYQCNNGAGLGNNMTSASNLAAGCLNNLNSTANGANGIGNLSGMNDLSGSSYANSFNNYDASYPRFDSSSGLSAGTSGTNTLIDENLLNSVSQTSFNDQRQASQQQQNIVWNKNTKFGKNNSLFTAAQDGGAYSGANNISELNNNINPQSQMQSIAQQQQLPFFYSNNCFVVNIEGPINFNATHSLLDDGSDLPMNDANTIRFFYNLGIEYYRLNIAPNPYQQQQLGNYQAAPYLPHGAQMMPSQPQGIPVMAASAPPVTTQSDNLAGSSASGGKSAKNEPPKIKDNSSS